MTFAITSMTRSSQLRETSWQCLQVFILSFAYSITTFAQMDQMWKKIKAFDAYPKTMEDFRVKTRSGALRMNQVFGSP